MLLKLLLGAILVLLLTVFAWCVYFFSSLLYVRWWFRHLPHPKMRSFIFGNAPEILECCKAGGHFSMVISKWSKIHGSVFVSFMLHRGTVICLEPSIVREILINTPKSPKPYKVYGHLQYLFGRRMAGYGLVSELDGERWELKRKMINPAFKRKYLIDLMYQYNNSVQELITYLSPNSDGTTKILMADEFNKVAMDIVAKVAFGLNDINGIADSSPYCSATVQVLAGAMAMMINPTSGIDPRKAARDFRRATQDAGDLMRTAGRKCILQRIQDMQDGKDYPKDILTHILQASQTLGKKITFGLEEMVDEFVVFFVAGQETTAQLMSFTFEMIGRHPDIYKKLQEEVDLVIGTKDVIAYEDISKLEYMSLVFKEVLRYTPPVVAVQRVTTKDLVINGYKIPARSSIGFNHYAMGRDERFFDDPDKFDPERFRNESDKQLYAYFPFSLGARVCIGQHFALIEAKVIIAKLLQVFDFTLVPGVELQFRDEVTLKSLHRTPITLTPRNGQVVQ